MKIEDFEQISEEIIKAEGRKTVCWVCKEVKIISYLKKHSSGQFYRVCDECISPDLSALDRPKEGEKPALQDTQQDIKEADTSVNGLSARHIDFAVLHKTRLKLLEVLRGRSLTQSEIKHHTTFKPDNVFYHMGILEKFGFVEKKKGKRPLVRGGLREVYYFSLTPKGEKGLEYFRREEDAV